MAALDVKKKVQFKIKKVLGRITAVCVVCKEAADAHYYCLFLS